MRSVLGDTLMRFVECDEKMCAFLVNFSDGSYEMTNAGCFEEMFSGEWNNPLEKLCDNLRVDAHDRPVITAFCRDLLDSSGREMTENDFNVGFKADISPKGADKPDWRLVSFTAVVGLDREGKGSFVVAHLKLMTSAEILNKTIIDSFTNDKHPKVFIGLASKIVSNPDKKAAIIQFDIENFKLINKAYGEETGTAILNFIKNGLATVCTEGQVYTRLSADVFMIAMNYDAAEDVRRLIAKIEERLSRWGDISYKLVFGVNFVTDRSIPMRIQGDRAALARQSIKGNALEHIGYYTEGQENRLVNRKFIEDRMDYALEHGEFVMYLQPKYSISQERVVGAEALVRWLQPEKGMIPPGEFIGIFEKNGFIIKLDEYMWEQACKTIRSWIDNGIEPVPISVNISRVHLSGDGFIDVLDRLVEKYNIPRNLLETEITETVEGSDDAKIIRKLKERGYMLLMDDFGSGYSSLNTLKSTPFDVIKIDRNFFGEFMLSDRGKKIIMHTISMSKDIGLGMVAEGVETREQAEFLNNCGCDTAQGFYYSRPICVSDFERLAFGEDLQRTQPL